LLKSCIDSLALPLSILFRKSITTGTFPSLWKKAHVTPIYKKKGKTNDPSSYRPISITCNMSKIFERIIFNKLYSFCLDTKVLKWNNAGFKKGDSTVNQLLYLTNLVQQGFDNGLNTLMVFLDIKAAFDTVWHNGLLFKLENYGICGQLLNWFKSYLYLRSQKVVIQGCCSKDLNTWSGVPQGSVLGPLLFLIYISDFDLALDSLCLFFADDSSMLQQYLPGNELSVSNIINNDLLKATQWADFWKMKFNFDKTTVVNFTLNKSRSNPINGIAFNGVNLHLSDSVKHLGFFLSYNLKWNLHINYLVTKTNSFIGLFKRNSRFLSRNLRHIVY